MNRVLLGAITLDDRISQNEFFDKAFGRLCTRAIFLEPLFLGEISAESTEAFLI